MKKRVIPVGILITTLSVLTACGTMQGLTNLMGAVGGTQDKADLQNRPFRARSFDAAQDKLVQAVSDVFVENGMSLMDSQLAAYYNKGMPEGWKGVWAAPKATDTGKVVEVPVDKDQQLLMSHPPNPKQSVYQLEEMTATVKLVDGKQAVFLEFLKGQSYSKETFQSSHPANSDDKYKLPDRELTQDQAVYGNLMDSIAAKVATAM